MLPQHPQPGQKPLPWQLPRPFHLPQAHRLRAPQQSNWIKFALRAPARSRRQNFLLPVLLRGHQAHLRQQLLHARPVLRRQQHPDLLSRVNFQLHLLQAVPPPLLFRSKDQPREHPRPFLSRSFLPSRGSKV